MWKTLGLQPDQRRIREDGNSPTKLDLALNGEYIHELFFISNPPTRTNKTGSNRPKTFGFLNGRFGTKALSD